ncbi:Uncharacterised protein [Achromobacter xylosoxidans]|nr:Uncharacterised protein [Achromobacter xylosoxidans]
MQDQRVVALDQAGAVVEHALRLKREDIGRDQAASVRHLPRVQRGLAFGGHAAAGVIHRAAGVQREFAAQDLAAGVVDAGGADVGDPPIQAAALVAQRPRRVERQLAFGPQDAIAVVDVGRFQRKRVAQQLAATVVECAAGVDARRAAGLDRAAPVVDAGVAVQANVLRGRHAAGRIDDGSGAEVHEARAGHRATGVIKRAHHPAAERGAAGELAAAIVQAAGAQRDRPAIQGAATIGERAAGIQGQFCPCHQLAT